MSKKLDDFKSTLITPLPEAEARYVIENFYEYELEVTPEEIWPYLSDTSRMNRELGFPPRFEKEIEGENHVSTKTLGRDEEWIEKPWIWVHAKELQSVRIFKKGWMTEQRGIFCVRPAETGCVVSVFFRWSFDNLFARILFAPVGSVLNKKFKEFFRNKVTLINQVVAEEKAVDLMTEPLSPYETLLKYLQTADELDLDRVHLKKIARIINLPVELLLEAAHVMTKEGLLTLSWDVVCPHCRGVRAELTSLSFLDELNTCEACKVQFDLGPEESIEVVFHLTEKLRKITKAVYCAAEPAKKKHIKFTQFIPAGEQKQFPVGLKPGHYRMRTKGIDSAVNFKVESDSIVRQVSWRPEILPDFIANTDFDFVVTNPSQNEITMNIEEAWWFDDRLMPKEILSNPLFRSMISEDHLKIGVKMNVGNQVIMFTDIVGSTPFYKSYGDAKALKAVKDHYQEVGSIIAANRGVVVKFIGDAVMAAFLDAADALQASIDIHKAFHAKREDTPIRLRASLHYGPVICANMNVGLDYFGNTVNLSAKIQKWADAHEIALTESDWKMVSKKFPRLKTKQIVKDEKLGVDVRIITVA